MQGFGGFAFFTYSITKYKLETYLRRKLSQKLNSTFGQWVAPKHIWDFVSTGGRGEAVSQDRNTHTVNSVSLPWHEIPYFSSDYRVNTFLMVKFFIITDIALFFPSLGVSFCHSFLSATYLVSVPVRIFNDRALLTAAKDCGAKHRTAI